MSVPNQHPPRGEVRRLGLLRQAEHVAVEEAGPVLPAGGHGQLHVIDTDDWHTASFT
ncbi:hypothetical protein [Mycobacterium sp.]|uniref:hypothetical protein n=1 Tax=Mycobacterium sp. TaxID=1785 RepID=UPI003F991BD9